MASSINASTSGAGGVITTADNTGILNLQTASTTAVTVDASQNVGIGTTSPASKLQVGATTDSSNVAKVAVSGSGIGYLGIDSTGTSGSYLVTNNSGSTANGIVTAASGILSQSAQPFIFTTNSTERMRIDSSGNVLINETSRWRGTGTVSLNAPSNDGIAIQTPSAGIIIRKTAYSNTYLCLFENNGGTQVGAITTNGTTTTYTTTSDYRLKENIVPMTGALDKVALLKPVTYKWKENNLDGQGFIAHELQEVVPECVVGKKDAVETYTDEEGNEQTKITPQGIDTSFLVATLTAAIQEQQALITSLTARITALEGA
jgi:hypothetical protein